MKNLIFFGVILSVAISATFADVECYYCGLRKACSDDPFDGSTTDKVTCSVGCLRVSISLDRSCKTRFRPRLGSVAGPVIQATGKSTFEDGLRLGGSSSDFK
jgi:hypothetical protein